MKPSKGRLKNDLGGDRHAGITCCHRCIFAENRQSIATFRQKNSDGLEPQWSARFFASGIACTSTMLLIWHVFCCLLQIGKRWGRFAMSITGVASYSNYSPSTARVSAKGSDAASFARSLDAAAKGFSQSTSSNVQPTDFTHMTRKEMVDWVNSKIKSGEMSLDGTEALIGMTIKISVNGAYTGLDDTEQVNFMQTAQDGMKWAQQHFDTDLLGSLKTAIGIMQRYQGQISNVDLKA